MAVLKVQSEIDKYKLLEKKILWRINLITQVIEKIENNELVYDFFVPYIGPSQDQVLSLISPDIRTLHNELVHFRTMWRNVHRQIEELQFQQFKEYTNEDIEKFHRRAKSRLDNVANNMRKGSDEDSRKVFQELLTESDSIIFSLCKLVRREPTKANMKRLLSEMAHNMAMGEGNSVEYAFKTLDTVVMQRLKYANDHYSAETNPGDYKKLLVALADAQLLGIEDDNPLMLKVNERISRIMIPDPDKDRKRRNEL